MHFLFVCLDNKYLEQSMQPLNSENNKTRTLLKFDNDQLIISVFKTKVNGGMIKDDQICL